MDASENLTSDRTLDATGLKCPLPALKARKVLLAMAEGQRLLLIATDPMAPIDIPHFCAEAGHRLVAATQQDDSYVFLIERGENPRGR
jgi:tRNA 2-thiouridine synthesizing protein A